MNKIYINYWPDFTEATYELMDHAKVGTNLKSGMKVIIKPNIVVPKPANYGATTHVEIIEGIIKYLKNFGIYDITIAEGSWIGVKRTAEAFKKCGFDTLSKRHKIKLLDTKDDKSIAKKVGNLTLYICKTFYEMDYFINVPVLKGHCQTKMTCCLKNLKGCIPDLEKRRYHLLGLSHPISALNAVLKPNLNIIDSICGDLDFEEGGNPVESNRVILAYNSVLADSYCAMLLGYDPNEIDYLVLSQTIGLGTFLNENTEIIEFNNRYKKKAVLPLGEAQKFTKYINENNACSACYSNLIFALNRLKNIPDRERIKIGQGWSNKKIGGIGIGNCTSGCSNYLKGCPPTAFEILTFLMDI